MDLLREFLDGKAFMPHGHCYLWKPALVWIHVISDVLIALAYTIIPLALVHLFRKRHDIHFSWMFLAFGGFIVFCGLGHVMEIINLWNGFYWVAGVVKMTTAVASIATMVVLIKIMPLLQKIPTPSDYEHQCERAIRDPLTGAYNRAYLYECGSGQFAFCKRQQQPISILVIDIDKFKGINDAFGHKTGDAVLKAFVKCATGVARASDALVRYGGDEFVFLCPNTNAKGAIVLAYKLQRAVNALQIENAPRLTISVGIASAPVHAADLESLFQVADQALYRSKDAGRSKVSVPVYEVVEDVPESHSMHTADLPTEEELAG